MGFVGQSRIQAYRWGMKNSKYIAKFMTLTDVSETDNYHILSVIKFNALWRLFQ